MKQNIRMRREDGKWITSTLIHTGEHVEHNGYEPCGVVKKPGVLEMYLDKGKYCLYKSEQRKREILANIRNIRKELAAIVFTKCHKDQDTIVRPNPVKAREAVHALEQVDKLVYSMFNK